MTFKNPTEVEKFSYHSKKIIFVGRGYLYGGKFDPLGSQEILLFFFENKNKNSGHTSAVGELLIHLI